MPKDINEYISVLRKYNQGVSDTDIKSYLVGVGYKAEEIDRALSGVSPIVSSSNESVGSVIKDKEQSVSSLPATDAHESLLPELQENHSIVAFNAKDVPNYSDQSNKQSVEEKIDKVQSDPEVNVPVFDSVIDDTNKIISNNQSSVNNFVNNNSTMSVSTPPTVPMVKNNNVASGKSKSIAKYVYITIIIILIVSFCNYVYFFKPNWFRKAPLTQDNFLNSLMAKLYDIDKTNYTANFMVDVTQKDADVEEYVPSDEVKEIMNKYSRDDSRLKDINNILEKLNTYFKGNKRFPSSLDVLKDVNKKDPKQNDYNFVVKDDGSDFTLSFSVESDEMVAYLKQTGLEIDGYVASINNKYDFSKKLFINLSNSNYTNYYKNPLNYLSSDVSISFGVSGLYIRNQGDNNTKLGMNGSFSGGDFNFAVDVETVKLADDLYVKINKAPSLFGDLSSIKLKWIKVTPQDITSNLSNIFSSLDEKKDEEIYRRQLEKILEVANEMNLLTYKEDPVIRNDKLDVFYDYKVQVSVDSLAPFYQKVTKELETIDKENPLIKYSDLTDAYLKGKVFKELFSYISKNQDIVITLNGKGLPVSLHYKLRILPRSDTKASEKQTNFYFDLKLSDINSDLTIEAPETSINFKEAYLKFTGQTEDEYMINKQYLELTTLVQALEESRVIVGRYPEELSKLTELIEKDIDGKDISRKLLNVLPKDVYTNKDFIYKKDAKGDYSIVYNIVLPTKIDNPKAVIYMAYDNLSTAYNNASPRIGLKFVNGENTLTSTMLSVEAADLIKKDTDKDNLSDSFEVFLGTDPKLKDTDKDGINDYDGFMNSIK